MNVSFSQYIIFTSDTFGSHAIAIYDLETLKHNQGHKGNLGLVYKHMLFMCLCPLAADSKNSLFLDFWMVNHKNDSSNFSHFYSL